MVLTELDPSPRIVVVSRRDGARRVREPWLLRYVCAYPLSVLNATVYTTTRLPGGAGEGEGGRAGVRGG